MGRGVGWGGGGGVGWGGGVGGAGVVGGGEGWGGGGVVRGTLSLKARPICPRLCLPFSPYSAVPFAWYTLYVYSIRPFFRPAQVASVS